MQNSREVTQVPFLVEARGVALAIAGLGLLAACASGTTVGALGGGRPPLVRVSDPQNQGDVVPTSTVVVDDTLYYITASGSPATYQLFRFETEPILLVAGLAARPEHLAPTGGKDTPVFFSMAGQAGLHVWEPKSGKVRPVPQKDGDPPLTGIHDIAVGKDREVFVLGQTDDRVRLFRVAADAKSVDAIPDTDHPAAAARQLFVAEDAPIWAYVAEEGERKEALLGFRDGKRILAHAAAAIGEVAAAGGVLFFGATSEGQSTSRLWRSAAGLTVKDLEVESPHHLLTHADQVVAAGAFLHGVAVFRAGPAAETATRIRFEGETAAYEVHGLVVRGSELYALADHDLGVSLWRQAAAGEPLRATCFVGDSLYSPRSVTTTSEGVGFLDSYDHVWIVTEEEGAASSQPDDSDGADPVLRLEVAGNDHFLVASWRRPLRGLYRSPLKKQNTGRTPR